MQNKRLRFEKVSSAKCETYDILSLCNEILGYIKLENGLLDARIRTAGNYDFSICLYTFKNKINQFENEAQRERYLSRIEKALNDRLVLNNAN